MAQPKWTKQQEKAIFHNGGALLVSAAAGSGKTAVLVERAVQLIARPQNPVPADSLLILTFTNAAAQELRARIAKRLEQELQNRPDDMNLRRQRLGLQRAFIGTLDAFCQQLVKEYFAQLDLPPDISLGDASTLQQLSELTMQNLLEQMYTDEDFVAFSGLYGRSRDDKDAQNAILQLYDFVRTLPAPNAQLQRFADLYARPLPFVETQWGAEMLDYGKQALRRITSQLHRAVQVAGQDEVLASAYLPVLAEDEAYAEMVEQALQNGEWDETVALCQNWKFAALKAVRGFEGGEKEEVKQLREEVKSTVKTLCKYCFVCTTQEFEQDRETAAPLVAALCRATRLYSDMYYAAKLGEKILDFADFEQLALQLLQQENGERTPACSLVSRRYRVVMVDEYQDTNGLQSALYQCLGNPEGSNLFYVGDVKQSIYRFRMADPGIFMQTREEFGPYKDTGGPSVLVLGHNFRSGPGVISGVNYVFSLLMSTQMGEVDYTEEERLIQGGQGGDEHGLELCVVEDEEGAGDAGFVAQRIAEMLQQGYPVRDGDGLRPCQSGDFCILLRARAKIPRYVAALEAKGVPVAATADGGLLQTPEVLPLVATLAAIDNPGSDSDLAAAMVGPLFGFTPDDMVQVRGQNLRGSLWGCVLACQDEKSLHFVQEIQFYRTLASQMPAGQLCEEVLNRTGYLSAVQAMENGPARRENLLRFVAWANEVSASGQGTLAGFARLLQTGQGPATSAGGKIEGCVNILTIHKSKGLEYPVCFLADAGHAFNVSDLHARVQLHAKLGIGIQLRAGDYLYSPLPALAVRRRNAREALSEEMRVLYVALTRAKEKVIVTVAHKNPAQYLTAKATQLGGGLPTPYLLGTQNSLADWLAMAALCHPQADPLLEHAGGAILPRVNCEGHFAMGVYPAPPAVQNQQQAFVLTAQPDMQLARQLAGQFEKHNPRSALFTIPAKVSVTQLAKQTEAGLRRRPSFMYKSGLTAAEKGTAQHTFMQFANFAAASQNLEQEIAHLVQQGYIQDFVAEKLGREGIAAFLSSGLCRRMLKAQKLLREYDFITALPASRLQPGLPAELQNEEVMVQGIADAVLVFEGYAEIADYKTDRGKTPAMLAETYTAQLQLYKTAVQKKLGMPVKKLTIWSFALGQEVDIPT